MKLSKTEILKNVLVEKQTTFLLGAGASAPFFSSLGNIERILSDTNITLDGIRFIKVIFYHQSIADNSYLIEYLENTNFENDRSKLMTSILDEYTRFIHNSIEFMKLRNSRISPKRTNIVSTNYDLFLEASIESILQDNTRVFFNDGANGYINRVLSTENFNKTLMYSGVFDNYSSEMPSLNLIKCHGSINWKKLSRTDNRDKILIDSKFNKIVEINTLLSACVLSMIKQLGDYSTILNIEARNLTDVILVLNGEYDKNLIDNINKIGEVSKDILSELADSIEQLQIVLPTKRKFQTTLIEEQYFNMLRLLSYELEKEQSVLVAFGFSFFDEHITEVVQRSLNNPNLLVFIFCYEDKTKNEIISRFSFSGNTKPSNVVFIQPSDFLIETIDKSKYDKDLYKEYKSIENDDQVKIYDSLITIQERKGTGNERYYIPIIDFAAFNRVLEGDLTNKYISKYNYGEEPNE